MQRDQPGGSLYILVAGVQGQRRRVPAGSEKDLTPGKARVNSDSSGIIYQVNLALQEQL
jgi:hypothetical protein